VYLSYQNEQQQRYLQLAGTASLVTIARKCASCSHPTRGRGFPAAQTIPHLVLIRIDVTHGTFWGVRAGWSMFLAALTKSVVTGAPGTSGRSGTIDL
jgi:general stress protein 26